MLKYYIKTFGCQMNVSDSERIAGFLETQPHLNPLLGKERGFMETKNINDADLVIFNTCGVRQMAEDRVYGQIHNIRKQEAANSKQKRKIIILTGCLANRKDVQKKLNDKVDLFCEIKNFPEEIESFLLCHPERVKQVEGSTNDYLRLANNSNALCRYKKDSPTPLLARYTRSGSARNDNSYLSLPPKYANSNQAYIPIMTGCNNFCAYCVVPYARGREWSRPMKDIISEIDNLAKNGCQEITLLGQNVNSYKYELPFPILLNHLAKSYLHISFKFLTSHPKDFSQELMQVIAENENISREIHLPIQAGSDKILRAMNRPYTQKHYLALIKKAQKIIPGVSFTTDVIVGFPGETEEDFTQTVEVFKKVKYNEAYINKYSPRPGTAAFRLGDPISWEEKKRREKVLRKCLNH